MVAGFTLGERARVDWWRVITDLERAGCSHPMIQAALGRSWGWVNYLKDSPDAEPKFGDGMHLLRLWVQHTGATEQEIPRRT